MSFEKWKARLAICQGHNTVSARRAAIAASGVKTFMEPDAEDEGYYRKPLVEPALGPNGKTNGQKQLIGWVPCAYFLVEGNLCGVIGAGNDLRDMTDDEVKDGGLWSWVVANPISYETYVAVAENGEPWPDHPKPVVSTPMNRLADNLGDINDALQGRPVATDNQPVEPAAAKKEPETLEEFQAAIATVLKNAPADKITSIEAAAIAAGNKNALAEIRLKADKAGRAIYEPLFRNYQKIQKAWSPLPKLCEDQEKAIQREINLFQEAERVRLAAEQAAAAQAIKDEEERNQRAADRAIANGEPEPEPEVTEIVVPTAIPAKITPTYGTRAVKQELQTFVTITDSLAVAKFFIANEKMQALLNELATNAIRAGVEVPGTTHRKGYA